jgi:hypothetical protein
MALPDSVKVLCQPLLGQADWTVWRELLAFVGRKLVEWPADLVVLDTVGEFWPVLDENKATEVTAALRSLRPLTRGRAVLAVHHRKKVDSGEFTSTRGSSAITAFVDVIAELRRPPGGDDDSRQRVLATKGRVFDYPRITAELRHNVYEALGEPQDAARRALLRRVLDVLPWQPPGLTFPEVWKGADGTEAIGGGRNLLVAALKLGVDAGAVARTGTGGQHDRFRYHRGRKD